MIADPLCPSALCHPSSTPSFRASAALHRGITLPKLLCAPLHPPGLRWNLDKLEMHMGGLISACNIIEAQEVWVETNTDLIWTTQVAALN